MDVRRCCQFPLTSLMRASDRNSLSIGDYYAYSAWKNDPRF